MTRTALLTPISKIKVGSSDEYPVTKVTTTHRMVGLDDTNTDSYEEITWQLECGAEVSAPTSITALNETLRSALAKRGELVTLTELGTARTLPASGAGGSMIGYPRVEITGIPEGSFGEHQMFTMRATTRIPIVDGNDIWEHSQTTETTTNIDGTQVTTVTGTLRMDQGNTASSYVQTNIIGPARTAAGLSGDGVVSKIKTGNDAAQCEYSYTITPSTTSTADVTQASVEDRTAKDATGRWVRTISGYAMGAGASTFASAQQVAESSNLKLIRTEGPSSPAVPDGRVNFNYQYASGVTHTDFPGIFITRMDETVDQSGGGREILASSYLQGDPELRLGTQLPVAVTESISIEFIGSFTGINPPVLLDEDNMVGTPRISKKSSGVFNTWSRSINYLYDTEPDPLPDPRSIDGIT